jgi:hypothetical protein
MLICSGRRTLCIWRVSVQKSSMIWFKCAHVCLQSAFVLGTCWYLVARHSIVCNRAWRRSTGQWCLCMRRSTFCHRVDFVHSWCAPKGKEWQDRPSRQTGIHNAPLRCINKPLQPTSHPPPPLHHFSLAYDRRVAFQHVEPCSTCEPIQAPGAPCRAMSGTVVHCTGDRLY